MRVPQGRLCWLLVTALAASPLSPAVLAQPRVLDEIVVTAQLRERSLQDVPVSVSAVSGVKMREAGIHRIEDLQAYVPNFTMSESGIGTDIYIRGLGSGENQGFEQSVGMYVDGIYYGRAQLARAPFLDLERVEVLRGPQNILMGKNSIAGAINIITARPSREFEGSVQATLEPDIGERILDLVLSGPLSDDWGYRLAMRYREYDGHIRNEVLRRNEPQRDEFTGRLTLDWDVSDNVSASLKFEASKFDVVGRHSEIINDEPSTSDVPFFAGRTYGEILHRTRIPDDTGLPADGMFLDIQSHPAVLNGEANYRRHSNDDFSDNNTWNVTLNVDWFRNGHRFSSISGFMAYDYDELCDCDFTGGDLFHVVLQEDYRQYSQEFRWISPAGDTWEFIGGTYFQYSDLHFFDTIIVDSNIVPELVNLADLSEGGARGDIDPNPLADRPEDVIGIGNAGNRLRNFRSPRDFTSESALASLFLQGTWNILPHFRLNLGGRYTYERKKGRRHMEFAFPDGSIRPIGEGDAEAAISFAAERHDLRGSRSESQFAPSVGIEWDLSPQVMTYATVSRGFKSGGFDARSNASPSPEPTPANPNAVVARQEVLIGSFEYEEEIATSFELGMKSTLFGGIAELNAALFRTEFDDLQVSVFDGTLGFNVGNAASAVTQGLEIDGRIALTRNLMLAGSIALLDFEFTDHPFGTCIQDQEPDHPNGINCDFTGKTNQYVANYSGNLLLAYQRELWNAVTLRANVDAVFTDDYHPSPNLDSRIKQSGYVQYNGRIALADIDGSWEVAVVGKNLSDELVIAYGQDAPTAKTIFETTAHHGLINPPRTFALQAGYRW